MACRFCKGVRRFIRGRSEKLAAMRAKKTAERLDREMEEFFKDDLDRFPPHPPPDE